MRLWLVRYNHIIRDKNMKNLKIVLICLLCLIMTACSNGFAKREYEDNEKISQMEDHYSKEKPGKKFCELVLFFLYESFINLYNRNKK